MTCPCRGKRLGHGSLSNTKSQGMNEAEAYKNGEKAEPALAMVCMGPEGRHGDLDAS